MYPLSNQETRQGNISEKRNVDWNLIVAAGPDGVVPADQVTNALLLDIRETARSIRKMAVFFTVIAIAALVISLIAAVANIR
jgi:hypothetical protein